MSLNSIIFILLVILCIVVIAVWFVKKSEYKQTNSASPTNSVTPPYEKKIPEWLEICLQGYENQALAYFLYQISLSEELSPSALDVQQKLGLKVYVRPALMLYEAKKQAGCSDSELDELLGMYYQRKNGYKMKIQYDSNYTVQEMILQKAQEKAKALQTSNTEVTK